MLYGFQITYKPGDTSTGLKFFSRAGFTEELFYEITTHYWPAPFSNSAQNPRINQIKSHLFKKLVSEQFVFEDGVVRIWIEKLILKFNYFFKDWIISIKKEFVGMMPVLKILSIFHRAFELSKFRASSKFDDRPISFIETIKFSTI